MATTTQPNIKPGWKTSEFWVAVLTPVAIIINNMYGVELPIEAIAVIIAAVAPYVVGRGIVKAAEVRRIPPK